MSEGDKPKKQSSLGRALSKSSSNTSDNSPTGNYGGGGSYRGGGGGGSVSGRGRGRGGRGRGRGRGRNNYSRGSGRGGGGRYNNGYNSNFNSYQPDNQGYSQQDNYGNQGPYQGNQGYYQQDNYNDQRGNYNDHQSSYHQGYNPNYDQGDNYRGGGGRGRGRGKNRGGYNNNRYDNNRGGGGGYSSNDRFDNNRGNYNDNSNRGQGYNNTNTNQSNANTNKNWRDKKNAHLSSNIMSRYEYVGPPPPEEQQQRSGPGGGRHSNNQGRQGGRGGGRGGRGGRGHNPQYNNSNTYSPPPKQAPAPPPPQAEDEEEVLGEFRGIFGEQGDSSDWLEACRQFPNGVPRFETKAECLEFMKDYTQKHGGSNPDYTHLKHIFTTLITWEQIERILIPEMEDAREESTEAVPVPDSYGLEPDDQSDNIYEQAETRPVVDAIKFRLDLPLHKCQTPESVLNTLKYSFHHMKRGIYVMIHNGELRIFCPFSNMHYQNSWSHALRLEGNRSPQQYFDFKARFWRKETIEPDMSKWFANGNILGVTPCQGDHLQPWDLQQWGDHFLCPLRDALAQACQERQLPDCEFFLNKRDYPQIKYNVERGVPVEPYGFIFDADDRDPDQDVDLVPEHCYETMAPMVSFYAASEFRFTDLPWPSSEDWEGACGQVFPQTFISFEWDEQGRPDFQDPRDLFTETNFCKFQRGWNDDRVATAFFRGSATGGGTTIDTNQRLKLAHLSHQWKRDPEKGGREPFLDAAITGWNMRDKKIASSPLTFVRRQDFAFKGGRQNYTPIYEQSRYKYLVYVDGHCAACRYGFMMRLGGVILKVESQQVADRMWYFPLLQPWVDHVPVKADLSDLEEKIRWCRDNDDKCQEIAANGVQFYERYVAQKALLDYIEMVTKHIAKRQRFPQAEDE